MLLQDNKKPTRLPLGHIADAMDDDEETLLALLATSQNVWLTTYDMTELNEIRRDMRDCDFSELGRMAERAADVLRRYLPEFTTFGTTLKGTGISIAVIPDEVALHKAEHVDRTLERGNTAIPYSANKRIQWFLSQFTDAKGVQFTVLYRKNRPRGKPNDWSLLWEYRE